MIITIIGIGLIGGSLALSLKQNNYASWVLGVDQNPVHGERAVELGIVDEVVSFDEGIAKADVVIIAVPVNAIVQILPRVLDRVDRQIVIDVGSTKESIVNSVLRHAKRGRFVATHPMAGTEYSGPEAAISDLFTGKCTVLVDKENSDEDALSEIQRLYQSLSMNIVYHQSHEHDIHTAYISHISHISSFALALTVLEKEKNEKRIFELAGGGFSSTVRLAKSSPDTWVPIFEQNRDYVLDVLDEHINTISQFRTLLIKKDFESFYKLIQQANQIRRIVK
ncbi:MAG: prephenate dehydrogenase [Saprospiraceae bacterium]|nr:prephenate dehydrogenase [Saprospiraceae bacterium]